MSTSKLPPQTNLNVTSSTLSQNINIKPRQTNDLYTNQNINNIQNTTNTTNNSFNLTQMPSNAQRWPRNNYNNVPKSNNTTMYNKENMNLPKQKGISQSIAIERKDSRNKLISNGQNIITKSD